MLGSVVEDNNGSLRADLTNPDIHREDGTLLPRDLVAIERTKFLFSATGYERIALSDYGASACKLRVTIGFESDFKDLFEVRGSKRKARGSRSARIANGDTVVMA